MWRVRDDRQKKLIELLDNSFEEQYGKRGILTAHHTADHLIANGVTFAKDTNVPSKWIPVTERLPEKDDYYLCCVKSFCFPGRTYINILDCDECGFKEGHIYTDSVTHWMPLPELPKELFK